MPDGLGDVLKDVAQARGLPNAHYVSDEVYGVEREALFFDHWAALGFASDIPYPGDAAPFDFLGMPLLAVRDQARNVRVYQNTCRHRGMILVEDKRNIGGLIRCPYHSWCYTLEGTLKATPHVGGPGHNTHEEIDRGALGLTEFDAHVWRDVIFVNINGNAGPFEEVHADAIARWGDFEGKPTFPGGAESRFTFDASCNWKLAVENYCESYHLPWVHPGLNSYSRLEDHYNIEVPGSYSGQGTLVYRQFVEDGRVFRDFPDMPEKWDTGAEYIALYPNVLLGAHRDHGYAIILQPMGKDRTIEHVGIHYAAEDESESMRQANAKLWYGVFEEDIFVVEGMQRGRHAKFFDGGKFSPTMDGPTHCFHHWVASEIERYQAGRPAGLSSSGNR